LSIHHLKRKQVLVGAIGNTLEWYDFAIYGFLAPIIGKAFFLSASHYEKSIG
jgi:MHS family proline/betaine transporter-like MFS transporter